MSSNHATSVDVPRCIIEWETDASDLRVRRVAPRNLALLGYAVEAWCAGDFWRTVLHERDRDVFLSTLMRVASSRTEATCEVRFVARDGISHWFFVHVRSLQRKGQTEPRLRGHMIRLKTCTEQRAALEDAIAEAEAARQMASDAVEVVS